MELKKSLAEQTTKDDKMISIKRRIAAAVESGELSREEADAKYRAVKDQITAEREK
jgi:hypothetical protein